MSQLQLATLGAGCFWCVEAVFASLKGVDKVQSGYCGGTEFDATYKQVCSGTTDHAEVIQVTFDSKLISFETLLEVFFQSHDPTTLDRQGNDVGPQYRSVIFYHSVEQQQSAKAIIQHLDNMELWSSNIVTEVAPSCRFHLAENYHNDYFALNGEQPYCQMLIKPKVDKIKQTFRAIQK